MSVTCSLSMEGQAVTSMSLPPLQNLPQWPRVQTLDKARYPRPFLKDHIQVLPPTNSFSGRDLHDVDSIDGTSVSGEMDPAQRMQHLEKSIEFLKKHHKEVLASLHDEIESLKKENKELQFKAIMGREDTPKKDSTSSSFKSKTPEANSNPSSGSQAKKIDQLKSMFLEEKIRELQGALQEARNSNVYLQHRLKETLEKRPISQEIEPQTVPATCSPPYENIVPLSIHPLQVQRPTDTRPRPPTLEECELIIRRLHESNERQHHELKRLKNDLKDVLYSHKWSPDAYLLAKAYIADEDTKTSDGKLPKIPLKNQTRKIPENAFNKDTISLPPLTHTMGNKIADRQKRMHAVKRARQQRKEVFL